MWKNAYQLEKEYKDDKFRKAFKEVYTLRYFLNKCVLPQGYTPPNSLEEAIVLTSEGEAWVSLLLQKYPHASLGEIKLAIFLYFYHQNLFVDIFKTNTEVIEEVINSELVGSKLFFPWVYTYQLYDRFFNLFSTNTTSLSYAETKTLLETTPQGVFQLGELLVGPFGLLRSHTSRRLAPLLNALLWHCSDSGCSALHEVKLSIGTSNVVSLFSHIRNESKSKLGPASEWQLYYSHLIEVSDYYDDVHIETIPWLIINGFSFRELKALLKSLLKNNSKEIRERFPQSQKFKGMLGGSADQIIQGLSQAQIFQLILLMDDETIIRTLEELVENDEIIIPPTEVREARYYGATRNWLNVRSQCSKFGVRLLPKQTNISLTRFKRLVKYLYETGQERQSLEWKLRHVEGDTISEKIETYLQKTNPRDAIHQLVLISKDNLERAFKVLKYGFFKLPSSKTDEDNLISKILWKLGFDVGIYPSYLQLFWDRYERFLEASKTYQPYTEQDRETIRSEGVNFFVSLEEILDYSLSFTTWALLSDHYLLTHFKCNFTDARKFMASQLNGLQLGSNEPLAFDADGKNTLYPLIRGFSVLAGLCQKILSEDDTAYKRNPNDFPGFHNKTDLFSFPFAHKALILDTKKEDREKVLALLLDITTQFETAKISSIRNRIQHKRSDFPNQSEIESACIAISAMVNQMQVSGVCPSVYFFAGESADLYRRRISKLEDYRGKIIEVPQPTQFTSCGLPSYQRPQVVFNWLHIGDSSEKLRFSFEESSDFTALLSGYPKRRTRLPINDKETTNVDGVDSPSEEAAQFTKPPFTDGVIESN